VSARGVTRWTRLGVGAQVGLAIAMALVAVGLLVQLGEWWYVRADLSFTGRNTLDPATEELVAKLPEPLEVDVFFRPLKDPFQGIAYQVQSRMLELLVTARNAHRDKILLTVHDPAKLESTRERQRELGVEGVNLIALSCGENSTQLSLFGEIAVIDWGNPTEQDLRYLIDLGLGIDLTGWSRNPNQYRPARLSQFNGAEAFAAGMLKVSAASSPKVCFSVGHGESPLESSEGESMVRLKRALEQDGFVVETWDALEEGAVPEDCEVLAIVGPRQPFQAAELESVRSWVLRGGRLIVAPSFEEIQRGFAEGVTTLLWDYAMVAQPGIVCNEIKDAFGQPFSGTPDCSVLLIGENGLSASHELTEPLRRRGRRVMFTQTHSFRRGNPQEGWSSLPLITSPRMSWLDLGDEEGKIDYRYDDATEQRGRYALCMLAYGPGSLQAPGEELRQPRVLGIASSFLFDDRLFDTNRDFLLNAFNWMAERAYRVGVSPRDPGEARLDLESGATRSILNYSLWLGFPGVCMLVGVVVAYRRRS
jgi:hypothetical protein